MQNDYPGRFLETDEGKGLFLKFKIILIFQSNSLAT